MVISKKVLIYYVLIQTSLIEYSTYQHFLFNGVLSLDSNGNGAIKVNVI